jgi:LuxR family maltose regulon positive regulatory protein
MRTFERALALATEQGAPELRGTADMYVGLSELFRERNELEVAARHVQRGQELGEQTGLPQYPYRWRVAMARIREAEGDAEGALDLLQEAERRYVGDFFPNVRPIAALKARIWVAQGREDEALAWAREHGLTSTDELAYLREFEHITLAKALAARHGKERAGGSMPEALALLDRLRIAAETHERTGSLIEILVTEALARAAQGDLPRALAPLERALTLAEPERYVRVFTGEGAPMLRLLSEARARGPMAAYADSLLASAGPSVTTATPAARPAQPLPEPLSEREIEVLRLIAAGLSNKEIGDTLFLALDTVKGHNRRIFGKLGVQRRTEAISRASDLGLL